MSEKQIDARDLAALGKLAEKLQEHFYGQDGNVYIDGKVRVVHSDGFQVGYFEADELGWNFCPEYKEADTDEQ